MLVYFTFVHYIISYALLLVTFILFGGIMPFSSFNNDKILFSVVDDVIDSNGKDYLVEVKFSRLFFEKFFSNSNDKLVVNIDNNSLITKREIQVLRYLSQGKNNYQIAKKLNVSVHTAKAHVQNIFKKLSVSDRTQAVVRAIKRNLIDV